MQALLIDAFDGFSHVIYQHLRVLDIETTVIRSGQITPAEALAHRSDFAVLGPGRGTPEDSGHVEMVRAMAGDKPILGMCLGHQAIAVAFGARVRPAPGLVPGGVSVIEHDGRGVFAGAAPDFSAARHHSTVVVEDSLPTELAVTARAADDGHVMGLRHAHHLVEGIQFHPEGVLADAGLGLFAAFAASVRESDP